MNLLYTLTAYPPSVGGAQAHQHSIACYLQSYLSHNVQVVSHWDSNRSDWLLGTTLLSPILEHSYTIDSIQVHRLRLSFLDRLKILPFVGLYYPLMRFSISRISPYLEAQIEPYIKRCDLIHNVRIGRAGISFASLQSARKYDIPFILTPVHHPRWKGWRYKIFNEIYRSADAVIALTPAEKKTLIILGVDADKIYVTGHGPVIAEQAKPKTFKEKCFIDDESTRIVLFLGQHYHYKGYKQLLSSAPLVWSRHPNVHFVFIGPPVGNSEKIFKELKDSRIHRLGKVDLQMKTDALAACDVLCVPSSQESFGGVYVEAWAFSKPVIGCKIPAVSDVISDEYDGYLVQQEPLEIADRINYLFSNPGKAAQLGEAGHEKMQSRYTWKRIAEMTEQVYFEVSGS